MKLGARIFKTGLAIVLALYVAQFCQLEQPVFAAVAAAFAVQPSIHRSFQVIIEQLQANFIGAILAIIFALTLGTEPFVVGVVAIITIAIILKLKLEENVVSLAVVTIIIIMESPAEQFATFAFNRFLLILIGIFSAFLVNLLFLPPRYETKLFQQITEHTEQTLQWIMLLIKRDADAKSLRKDITRLSDKMIKIDNYYLFFKDERNDFFQNRYSKARKVVLFRQMIVALKKAQQLLLSLERRKNEFNELPEEIRKLIISHLDILTNYHHLILLRYGGKVKDEATKETVEEIHHGKKKLFDSFMELYEKKIVSQDEWYYLFPLISHIVEYEEQLEHLDQLVNNFFHFHTEENKVELVQEE